MKLDFLIYYEHASRELESDCYLASILKNRGYKVKVINRHYLWRVFLNPSVIVVPFLYGNKDVHEFTGYISGRKRAIVNLQYEQMLNEAGLKASFYHPSGMAKEAYHICWGVNTQKRLTGDGIPKEYLPITGAIGMDFNRQELRSLLKDKREIGKEFNLDPEKSWHLFISSFSLSSLSESDLKIVENKLPGYGEFVDISRQSQKEIIVWFKTIAKKYPNKVFIYRPHPNERKTALLEELASASDNIHVIGNYSIRQWINICENSSSWFSTSTVDCYFAQRPCCVLRPFPIPEKFDQKIFLNCKFISDIGGYEEFLSDSQPPITPLMTSKLSEMYMTDMSVLYGVLTADVCEQALKGNRRIFMRNWKDCAHSFKYDVLASFFRLIPALEKFKDSRFYGFHVKAQETKRDRKLLAEYMKKFDGYWNYGK